MPAGVIQIPFALRGDRAGGPAVVGLGLGGLPIPLPGPLLAVTVGLGAIKKLIVAVLKSPAMVGFRRSALGFASALAGVAAPSLASGLKDLGFLVLKASVAGKRLPSMLARFVSRKALEAEAFTLEAAIAMRRAAYESTQRGGIRSDTRSAAGFETATAGARADEPAITIPGMGTSTSFAEPQAVIAGDAAQIKAMEAQLLQVRAALAAANARGVSIDAEARIAFSRILAQEAIGGAKDSTERMKTEAEKALKAAGGQIEGFRSSMVRGLPDAFVAPVAAIGDLGEAFEFEAASARQAGAGSDGAADARKRAELGFVALKATILGAAAAAKAIANVISGSWGQAALHFAAVAGYATAAALAGSAAGASASSARADANAALGGDRLTTSGARPAILVVNVPGISDAQSIADQIATAITAPAGSSVSGDGMPHGRWAFNAIRRDDTPRLADYFNSPDSEYLFTSAGATLHTLLDFGESAYDEFRRGSERVGDEIDRVWDSVEDWF